MVNPYQPSTEIERDTGQSFTQFRWYQPPKPGKVVAYQLAALAIVHVVTGFISEGPTFWKQIFGMGTLLFLLPALGLFFNIEIFRRLVLFFCWLYLLACFAMLILVWFPSSNLDYISFFNLRIDDPPRWLFIAICVIMGCLFAYPIRALWGRRCDGSPATIYLRGHSADEVWDDDDPEGETHW